jgi:hypothetical protein
LPVSRRTPVYPDKLTISKPARPIGIVHFCADVSHRLLRLPPSKFPISHSAPGQPYQARRRGSTNTALAREVFERDYLIAQISRFSGNISRTAEIVGMERSAHDLLHRCRRSAVLMLDLVRRKENVMIWLSVLQRHTDSRIPAPTKG